MRNLSIESISTPVTETRQKRVLDLGIGIGGGYLNSDRHKGIKRIGVDINPAALEKCQRDYGSPNLELQVGDIFVKQGEVLPFKSKDFDEVTINFPHYTALYALISNTSILWNELNRVLTPNGLVQVLSDVDADNYRILKGQGRRVHLERPDLNMQKAAEAAGFFVTINTVTPLEAEKLKTPFAKNIAASGRTRGTRIYQLIAHKGPVMQSLQIYAN